MLTIKNDTSYEYLIKKSKFISFLYYIDDEDMAKNIIDSLKKEYSDATHVCFGYIIDNIIRFSDDGEPNGTAGMPIINVLSNKNVNHVLAVVVRYFGGIKLGAGGLVRAYTNSIVSCFDNTEIVDLIDGFYVKVSFDISDTKNVDSIINKFKIEVSKEYLESVYYSFYIPCDDYKGLIAELNKYVKIVDEKNALIR